MRLPLLAALAIATFAGSSHAKEAIDQEQADAFVRMLWVFHAPL
jgi:membrane protein YdbS with pleckstrin-like domain